MHADLTRSTARLPQLPKQAVVVVAAVLSAVHVAAAIEIPGEALLDGSGIQGGLVVHTGCDNSRGIAALHADPTYLVHALDTDTAKVNAARADIESLGLTGPVSADRFDGQTLPYVDGLVNLIVVSSAFDLEADEIARALAPRGVLAVAGDALRVEDTQALTRCADSLPGWTLYTKPVPAEMDEWTHFLHGPDGHVMSHDSLVASPQHIQWVGSPRHAKSHSHLTTVNVMVSGGGRLFTIADASLTALPDSLPSRWALCARDAFNGIQLWKRPLTVWQPYYVADRNSYPADLHRRLVAGDDVVYATLSIFGPVSALDAASGRTVRTYSNTEQTEEIVHENGVLYLSINTGDRAEIDRLQMAYRHVEPQQKRMMAVRAETGEVLWQKCDQDSDGLLPMTLAVRGERLVFQNPRNVVCCNKQTGEVIWRSARPTEYFRPGWSSPTLVALDDVVISADRQSGPNQRVGKDQYAAGGFSTGDLVVFSAETGQRLWSAPCAEGCRAPTDVFSLGDRLWFGKTLERKTHEYREVHDLHTGKVLHETPLEQNFPNWHHHRCHRDKATCNFILAGRTGVEFIDLESGRVTLHNWIRGSCKFGVLPCNGLLYLPPEQCGCYIESKLTGFHALAGERRRKDEEIRSKEEQRIEKGPAYADARPSSLPVRPSAAWPTFRGDNLRSGCVDTEVPTELRQAWRIELGGRLTQPVVADGKLFVASVDAHTLHVLDAVTGKPLYRFIAGGRIDSPPTLAAGLAVFGCGDGWIYAVNQKTGRLAWRYRAAPENRKLVDNGRVESVWPVHGSVLVQDQAVHYAAGRSSYVDGGVRMGKLDLVSGQPLLERTFSSRDPETGETVPLYEPFPAGRLQPFELPGVLPDVLSSDGEHIWMRAVNFDSDLTIQQERKPHLFSSMGFLDDSWWELTYWIYGQHMFSGRAGIARAVGLYPTARIMVCDQERIYGNQEGYESISEPAFVATQKSPPKTDIKGAGRYRSVQHDWSRQVPLHTFGLVLAGETLFLAGPPRVNASRTRQLLKTLPTDRYQWPDVLNEAAETFVGVHGGVLYALGKQDGRQLTEVETKSIPVFDGLIAADKRLYMAMQDGTIVCME